MVHCVALLSRTDLARQFFECDLVRRSRFRELGFSLRVRMATLYKRRSDPANRAVLTLLRTKTIAPRAIPPLDVRQNVESIREQCLRNGENPQRFSVIETIIIVISCLYRPSTEPHGLLETKSPIFGAIPNRRLAHENEYRTSSLDEDRPSASTSYAQTAGQLLDTVQTATADALGGVSSSFRRASNVKHRQRAGREGQSLLAHDDDFEDGAVLSKDDARKGGVFCEALEVLCQALLRFCGM